MADGPRTALSPPGYGASLGCAALLALSWLGACESERARSIEPRWLSLSLGGDEVLDSSQLQVRPADAVGESRLGPGRVLHVEAKALPFRLKLPGFCPLEVTNAGAHHTLTPLISLPPVLAEVGFDAEVTLHAEPGCESARRGRVHFRQLQGPKVTLTPSADGFGAQLRTPPAPTSLSADRAHGLVPVGAGDQQRLRFEARFEGPGGEVLTRSVTVTAAARATGLPTLPAGQRYFLRGDGWRVVRRPPRSTAEPAPVVGSALLAFTPDRAGRYALEDADGCALQLHAGSHAEVPLDCGRAPCHAALSESASHTPMAHALDTLAVSARGATQGCLPDCHFTGQAGILDGGFAATAAAMQFRPLSPRSREALPVALARFAGVGCTACHGPAAIPPASGRARVVSAELCASCHDLPAPLDVVASWRSSAMARADRTPESREGACAQCHTTLGFLDRIGVRTQPRPASRMDRASAGEAASAPRVEKADGHTGVACAACHAVHGAGAASGTRLLRNLVGEPTASGDAPGKDAALQALCSACHAPLPGEARPSASAASLVSGRVEVLGRASEGASPHGSLGGACTACHGHRAADAPEGATATDHSELRAGIDHTFRAAQSRCADCHDAGMGARTSQAQRDIEARAQALGARLQGRCGEAASSGHAQNGTALRCDSPALRRAAYALDLVRRDRAAAVHNLPFTEQLLDEAQEVLGGE